MLICSPALADANNGNWQTASRWARMLKTDCRIGIVTHWRGEPCDLLIALHARRSAAAVADFAAAHPDRPCIVVLTGTDLYRDIGFDASAQASLRLAHRLVVLQDQGLQALPAAVRGKAVVIYQSARRLQAMPPPARGLKVVCVAHLRDEKDPLTLLRAAARLRESPEISFTLIGDALDAEIGAAVQAACRELPSLRWLGGLPRPATRQHIRRSQVLVNSSRMEGGAHVILEAAQSATAVVASRIPGNVGMLGDTHAGLFDLGDDASLAGLLSRAAADPAFLHRLRSDTLARADLFEPAEEQRRLRQLITECLETTR
ncbi:selenoneine biosynthesis selenosugar synthase SenB [Piscinibacter sakaiensis]|uniref:selenoneine biosynthesis selenosugar synthase SenB n=1 Tax=Piscinibacter sakaiensis TaxID=1547922 RepID=UPI003AACF348